MIRRCYNPECDHFRYYGERGILVCDRWLECVDNFIDDMGGFGVNRSGQVRFWLGGHQLSHTLARTTREMLTRVWVQTNENAIVQAAGSSSASALAREGWIDGFEGDISYAQQVASTTRDELARQAKLRSVKLLYNAEDDGRRLFSDFTYCDLIAVEDDDGTMHTLKVDSIAWRVGSDGPIDFEVTFLGE